MGNTQAAGERGYAQGAKGTADPQPDDWMLFQSLAAFCLMRSAAVNATQDCLFINPNAYFFGEISGFDFHQGDRRYLLVKFKSFRAFLHISPS
ncbi:hypothetical protein [Rhizobium wenxiniae]|uniref:hypothetical protein n=1 Tax=Rhizobium wenxiniae TaxID=1737357 RepID=UPI001C6F1F9A|nr:hypothetical protein [Rhizobium wenxiniae]